MTTDTFQTPRAQVTGLLAAMFVFSVLFLLIDLAGAVWAALFFALLTILAVIDLQTETVPDALTLSLAASGLAHSAFAGVPLLPIAFTVVALLSIGVLQGVLTEDTSIIGSGDLFLIAGVAAWFGPLLMLDILLIASAALLLHCTLSRRCTRAFAPALLIGATLVWFGGPIL